MTRSINNGYYALRWNILERDSFTCQYCGQYAPNVKLEIDHVTPIADGGTDDPTNLKTSCYACNRGKEGFKVILKHNNKLRMIKYTPCLTQNRVVEYMKDKGILSASKIAKELNINIDNSRMTLFRLMQKKVVQRVGRGEYSLIG